MLEIPGTSKHCLSADLLACTLNVSKALAGTRFTLISYSTKNILDYGVYSLAVNVAYAEQNGYDFLLTSPESGHEYDSFDQRWNKVKIISEMLRNENYSSSEYFVWLDSDLIILDFAMKLEGIIDQYPSGDLIVSRDADPAGIFSIANTGFIIVKRSVWSIEFLATWWGTPITRATGTDQHIFTTLWNSNHEIFSNHIVLLAPDAINTKRPATLFHMPYNQVIHMIGSVPSHRIAVFKSAFMDICDALGRKDVNESMPSFQLGITRSYLQELESNVLNSRVGKIKELYEHHMIMSASDLTWFDLQEVIRIQNN